MDSSIVLYVAVYSFWQECQSRVLLNAVLLITRFDSDNPYTSLELFLLAILSHFDRSKLQTLCDVNVRLFSVFSLWKWYKTSLNGIYLDVEKILFRRISFIELFYSN